MGISDSELYKNLKDLFRKYKDFSFKGISQIPYSAVPSWKAFADGNVEEALKEEKGVWANIKDFYAISILRCIGSIIGFWYIVIFLGLLLGGAGVLLVALSAILDPFLTFGALAAIAVLVLLSPAILLLLQGGLVHLLAKIAGGKGSFSRTLSVIVVGAGAALTLMIPMFIAYALIVGFFISPLGYAIYLFVLYLQYKGIKHVHQLSTKRAAAVVLGSIAVVLAVYMAFMFLLFVINRLYSSGIS